MRSLSVGIFLIVWLVVVPRNIFAQGDGDLELNLFFGGSWHSTNGFEIGFPQAVTPIQSEFKFNQLFAADSVSTSGHWGEEFTYSFESNEARFITKSPTSSELALGMRIPDDRDH